MSAPAGGGDWAVLRPLFVEALERDEPGRQALIAELAARDQGLAAQLAELLRADAAAESALDAGAAPLLAAVAAGAASGAWEGRDAALTGERLGPWRVGEPLGRGGMGVVFAAERDDGAFTQDVAIKVLRRTLDTPELQRRFRLERQLLARLDHPAIVKLIDGGVTADGLPWFALERVEGLPITDYARRHELPVGARVALLVEVCAAVESAHRRLVVHRDLKPSNVLITAEGHVKLLDFGIAKVLAEEGHEVSPEVSPEVPLEVSPHIAPEAAPATRVGGMLMTPQYAAPEQILGEPATTAVDVYALGAMLYELLTGSPPHPRRSTTPAGLAREVERETVVPPSHHPAVRGGQGGTSSAARTLRGDLDAVVSKALRAEPGLRYGSAAELGADLRRFLERRPVAARRGTFAYTASRFAARHRWALLGTAAGISLLAATVVVSAVRLRAERDLAQRRYDDVRALASRFLFDFHDAIRTLPGATGARTLVVRTATEYLEKLAADAGEDPGLAFELARAYVRLGNLQGGMFFTASIGDTAGALSSYRKGLGLIEPVCEQRPADLAALRVRERLVRGVGRVLHKRGDHAQAAGSLLRGRALADELLVRAPTDPESWLDAVYVRLELGDLRQSEQRFADADGEYRDGLAIAERGARAAGGDRRVATAVSHAWSRLAWLAGSRERWPDAIAAAERYLESTRALSERSPGDAETLRDLGVAWRILAWANGNGGDASRALEASAEALAILEPLAASDSSNQQLLEDIASTYETRGGAHARGGNQGAARADFSTALHRFEALAAADPDNATYREAVEYQRGQLRGLSGAIR